MVCYGHVNRMENGSLAKIVMNRPEGEEEGGTTYLENENYKTHVTMTLREGGRKIQKNVVVRNLKQTEVAVAQIKRATKMKKTLRSQESVVVCENIQDTQ